MKMSWNVVAIATALGMTTVACGKKADPKPAAPVAVNKPAEPAKPEEKPAEPAKPEEKPAEPEAKPAEPEAKPEEKPADPAKPEEKPADPVAPADPAKPADPAVPVDPAKPADPAAPADPAKPADPAAAVGHADAVQATLAALTEKNYDAALGHYTDNAVWESVGEETATGKEAIKANFTKVSAILPDLKVKASWIFEAGENAVAIVVMQGTNTASPSPEVPATNKALSVEGAYVYHFDAAGKIDKVTEYVDGHKVAMQLGFAPVPEGSAAPALAAWPETTNVVKGEANEANVALVKGNMDAFKADTFEARFRETLAADFVMIDPNSGAPITGVDAAIDHLKKGLFAVWPDFSATSTLLASTGDWVIFSVDNKATYKGGIPNVAANAQVVQFKSLDFSKVENGKVRSYLTYFNGAEIGKALGLVPGGAAKPAEGAAPTGEAKPAEGAAPTGEAKPAEGTAPTGEAKPAEGAAKPAEGEAKPAEGEAKPAEGAAPTGEAKPAEAPAP